MRIVFLWVHGSSSSSFPACNSRLRSASRRSHTPQRPVLGHIHCFRQCEITGSQILLYGAQPSDTGASSTSPPSSGGRDNRIDRLGICIVHTRNVPKRDRRCDWTIAVSLGCPVSLRSPDLVVSNKLVPFDT